MKMLFSTLKMEIGLSSETCILPDKDDVTSHVIVFLWSLPYNPMPNKR